MIQSLSRDCESPEGSDIPRFAAFLFFLPLDVLWERESKEVGSVLWLGARAVVVWEVQMLYGKNANRNSRNPSPRERTRIGIRGTRLKYDMR